MTRNVYSFSIFFTGLCIAISLWESIIFFRLGARMYELPSIASWTIFSFMITVAWSLLILKYYHYKRFHFAMWTLTAAIVASLLHFYLFYRLISTKEISFAFILATMVLLATSILYSLSLIFSVAGNRPWLKAGGIFLFLMGVATAVSFVWAIVSVSARINGTIASFEQWISLGSSLVPTFFILNFLDERATAQKTNALRANYNGVLGVIVLFFIVVTVFFAKRITMESLTRADNADNVDENLKRMASAFEARTFVSSDGDSLPYRLMKPLDFDTTRQYPLVVCLHGSSAVGTDNVKQIAYTLPAQLLATDGNRRKYPAFLFVPQCPRGFGWGGLAEQPSVDSLVFQTITALEREFPIDSKRRYVSGYSMGGYGAWHFICARPEMFAAAVPICGGGDPALADKIVDMPVWAFHGANDLNVRVSGTRDIVDAMRKAGGNPRYTEFPNAGHDIWAEVTQTSELPEWLFAQKRK